MREEDADTIAAFIKAMAAAGNPGADLLAVSESGYKGWKVVGTLQGWPAGTTKERQSNQAESIYEYLWYFGTDGKLYRDEGATSIGKGRKRQYLQRVTRAHSENPGPLNGLPATLKQKAAELGMPLDPAPDTVP